MLCIPNSIVDHFSAVNNTNELGPAKVMSFLANDTTVTLGNLNSSMLYKFYLSAKTIKGSGPIITEEAFTVMDTSESSLHNNNSSFTV